uniref:Uncharacterized protein n=1 Tax=Panagrolaimus sp. JU765 TaxID=591449 RepID=A0AC34Q2I7_9BILA
MNRDRRMRLKKDEKSKWILKPIKAKAVKKPKYFLQVLSEENAVANVVNIGRKGHLLITMTGESEETDFAVSNLTAEDTTTQRKLYLIDGQGCVVNNSIIQTISKPTKSQIKIDIEFAGFSDKAQVVYHAVVKPCKTGCILKCNQPYYKKEFS